MPMRRRYGLALPIVAAMALGWAFPVQALPRPTTSPPLGSLLPPWYAVPEQQPVALTASGLTPPLIAAAERVTITLTVTNPSGAPMMVTQTTPPGTVFDQGLVLDHGGAQWFMGGLWPGQSGELIWFTGDRIGLGAGLPRNATAILAMVVRPVSDLSAQSVPPGPGPTPLLPLQAEPPPEDQTLSASATSLDLAKSDSPDPVDQGATLVYTIVVTNSGTVTAGQVMVTDTTPAGTTFVSANVLDGGGAIWFHGGLSPGQAGSYLWFTGDRLGMGEGLWPGAHAVLQLTVRPTVPTEDQSVLHNNAYQASAANADPATGADVTTTVNAPAFVLDKLDSGDPITAGERLTYTVLLTNTGHLATSLPITIVETLPAHTVYATSDPPAQVAGDTLTWTLASPVEVGGGIGVTFAVTVARPLTAGLVLANQSCLAFSGEVTPSAQGPLVTTTVRSWPLLSVNKADSPDPVLAGGTIHYTFTVANDAGANGPAQGLVLTERVPLSTTLVSAPEGTWNGTGPGSLVTWTLPSFLWPGRSAAFGLELQVDSTVVSGSLIINDDYGATADNGLTGAAGDPVTTTVYSFPDLRLVKAATPDFVSPDDWLTFTLAFSNAGTTTAGGIQVTDTLPISLTDVASTTTNNVTLYGAAHPHYTWTVSPLAPGEWGAITLTARVITTTAWGQSTLLVNWARISTTDSDIQPDNNADEATVTVVPGRPAQVYLTASPAQTSVDCRAVVTATVLDAWGNPVADGTRITFTTSTATSAASPPSAATGLGMATTMVTSTRPDPVVVTATSPNQVSGTVTLTFTAGAPHTFVFAPIASPQTAGGALTIIFTATDQYGNLADTFSGSAALTDTTSTLLPLTSNPAVGGVLTQSVIITRAMVADVITASASGDTLCGEPWEAIGSSAPFRVVPGLATALEVAPQNGSVVAGQSLTYTALATDAYGNGWTATSEVTFTTSGGNAFLGAPPGNNVFSAIVAGVDFPVTATISGAGGPVVATTGVSVTHGSAVSLVISPRDATATAGDWVTYTAVATDAFGNDWDATGEVAWSTGGGNLFAGNVLSATVAGTWPVTGTLGGVSDSTLITITPGTVAGLALAPVSDLQTAGVSFGLMVTATDGFGNIAAYDGGLALTDTTSTLAPTTASLVNGLATPSVTVYRAWVADRITVSLAATPTILAVSNPFTVQAGAPATVIYTTPTSLRLCQRALVTATVSDGWGNPVRDGTVVSLTASIGLGFVESGGTAHYPTTLNGSVTATLLAGSTSGLASTEARAGSVSSGLKGVTIITPGIPYSVSVVANPATIAAISGTAAITATVYDCAAYPLQGETVVFTASLGSLHPLSGLTDWAGRATTGYSSTHPGTAVVTATANGAYGTVQVAVTPPESRVYLPLVLRNYRGVNLVVESVVFAPLTPTVNGPFLVSVTVRNLGPNAAGTFWVDLYLDPKSTPGPGVAWNHVCTEGVAWRVAGLGGGQSLTLRSDQGARDYTYWTGRLAATPDPHILYAVVDSWPYDPLETVGEDREDDNTFGPVGVPMQP